MNQKKIFLYSERKIKRLSKLRPLSLKTEKVMLVTTKPALMTVDFCGIIFLHFACLKIGFILIHISVLVVLEV